MEDQDTFRSELKGCLMGGVLSLIITILVYIAVTTRVWQSGVLAAVALVGAALQFVVQSRYFLHLKARSSSPLMRLSIVFTLIMLLIIVIGSLWIMMNLNYNMGMAPEQMEEYMLKQNRKGF